jgi:hypothetical protein
MGHSGEKDNRRDIAQVTLAFACLAAVVAFTLFVDSGPAAVTRRAAAPPHVPTEEEIYTGSILFMPYEGNDCRQSLLDNLTGQIRDNGVVPCDRAMIDAGSTQRRAWSAARVDAIRDGFARR